MKTLSFALSILLFTALGCDEETPTGPSSVAPETLQKEIEFVDPIVQVDACLRFKEERPQSNNIHVISIYEPRNRTSEPVEVHVAQARAILYLSSYESTNWKINLAEGASVSRVYLNSYDPSTVTGVPDSVVSEVNVERGLAWQNDTEYASMIEEIRSREGKNEASFQGCYGGKGFKVPYSQESVSDACAGGTPASHYKIAQMNCDQKCLIAYKQPGDPIFLGGGSAADNGPWSAPIISGNGLEITGQSELVAHEVQASVGKSCGKFYFEYEVLASGGTWWGNEIGVLPESMPLHELGHVWDTTYHFDELGTVGVALDLDAGEIRFSFDGNSSGQTQSLKLGAYEPVYPTLSVSADSKLRANFGAQPFKHTPPSGFQAYR